MKNMDSRITEPILVHASRKPKNAPSHVTKRVYGTLPKDRNVLDAQQNHTIRTDVTKKTLKTTELNNKKHKESYQIKVWNRTWQGWILLCHEDYLPTRENFYQINSGTKYTNSLLGNFFPVDDWVLAFLCIKLCSLGWTSVAQTFWPFWAISGDIFETICQSGFEPWWYCDVESSLCAKTKSFGPYSLSPSDSIWGRRLVPSMVCPVNKVVKVYRS